MALEQELHTKGSILLVDDELQLVNVLEFILKKHYEVKTASSGVEALQILQSGFRPGVILSDLKMPGMNGAEFLEQSIAITPNSSRIIITSYSSPKEIIPYVNQAKALFYLTKPTDEIQLVQAVKLGLEINSLNTKNRELNKKVTLLTNEANEKNDTIKNLLHDNKLHNNQAIQAISTVLNTIESFYFTNHINAVTVIAKDLAKDLKLDAETQSNIILASLLHSVIYAGMPAKLLLNEPSELDEKDRDAFLNHFHHNIASLAKFKAFAPQLRILNQIWERLDGTGFPHSLNGTNISTEASIIAIANLYHNSVYRMAYKDFQKFLTYGKVVLTGKELYERHNECIKSLYRKANWFELDVFNGFHDLIKMKACIILNPDFTKNIELKYKNYEELKLLISSYDSKNLDAIDAEKEAINATKSIKERVVEIDNIYDGMIISRAIISEQGVTICKQGTRLDAGLIKNITNMYQSDLIDNKIYIEINQD
jgi:response regulator RpfG family c-di-GMP phosphodiesterase